MKIISKIFRRNQNEENCESSRMEDCKKIEKPIISCKTIERYHLVILNTFATKENISIKFYSNGCIYEHIGSIKRIDIIDNCLVFTNNIKIYLEDIIEVYKYQNT